ncbi:MAG: ferredoxin--NADP reductase [Elusimicrobiota bacterium]
MKTVNSKFVFSKEICPGVKSFYFRPLENFDFKAGQFAFFTFNNKGKEYSKHFTISSSPLRENIEMTTIMSGSDYKNALDRLKKGDPVSIRGPFGKLSLGDLKKDSLCFLAGGIGITPFKSIIEYCFDSTSPLNAFLFYSNRSVERIAFRQDLKEFQKKLSGLKLIHTISSPDAAARENWKGNRGYIDAKMIRENCPEYSRSLFYIAGPPAFVSAMRDMASGELEMPEESIKLENFSGY